MFWNFFYEDDIQPEKQVAPRVHNAEAYFAVIGHAHGSVTRIICVGTLALSTTVWLLSVRVRITNPGIIYIMILFKDYV